MPPTRIPSIPGTLVRPPISDFLRDLVARLCLLEGTPRFPGSQPVSFTQKSLALLESQDFWVCEKSDGVRVLVLIAFNGITNQQDVFLIDRKEDYRQVEGLRFPNGTPTGSDPKKIRGDPLGETLLDGELVVDVDPETGRETLRLYAFDCIVFSGENLFHKPLSSRYGRLKNWVIRPHRDMPPLQPQPSMPPPPRPPFQVVLKPMELAYGVEKVMRQDIPKLMHGHDGLIFTCCGSGYITGTDEMILKWKPPSENSIDFKLELRFPQLAGAPDQPDFGAMPVFSLLQWAGGENYEFFDTMVVDEAEWEQMKESRQQYDDAVVECTWDFARQSFRIMRIRDDKHHGNHKTIVTKILDSIKDGVEEEELFAHVPQIRAAWKQRLAQPPPPPQAYPPPHQGYDQGQHQQQWYPQQAGY